MPKPRKQNARKTNPRILILCEGKETEPNYFNGLKADKSYHFLSSVDVVVYDTNKNTAKELVKEAITLIKEAKREKNPIFETWVVVDRDGYTKHPHAFDQAAANDVCIAFSSISFEYWLLLHFEYTTKAFRDCDQLIKHLKDKRFLPGYGKSSDIYAAVKVNTDTAIEHARQLRKNCPDLSPSAKPFDIDPYTNVDILVSRLIHIDTLKDDKGNFRKIFCKPMDYRQ